LVFPKKQYASFLYKQWRERHIADLSEWIPEVEKTAGIVGFFGVHEIVAELSWKRQKPRSFPDGGNLSGAIVFLMSA
jgi:hypothetical protein